MSEHKVSTRPAQSEDVPIIVEMQHQLAEYCQYDMQQFHINERRVGEVIDGGNESPERFFVAEVATTPEDMALAGMIYVSRTSLAWTGRRGVYVEDLFVQPELRGHHVGRHLLARAAELALTYAGDDTERAFMRLDTGRNNNDDTLQFYDHLGFDAPNVNLRLTGEQLHRLAVP